MKLRIVALAAAAVVGLTACDGESTTDPPPTPTVAVSLGSTTGQITQAGTLAVTVNVTRGGGFDGAVTLTASGVSGITAAPATIAANATSGTLTLTAAAGATPGAGTLTITAAGPNSTPTATATLALTVNVLGTYTLASNPASATMVQGASANTTVSVNRVGGFAGAVALAATAPAGITATLTPASLTGTTTATLAITAGATLAAGTYPITITGTTPGLANQTLTVNAVVTAAGSYTLAIAPATVPIQAGASGTANVTITRLNNFAGTVNLAATAPAGITVTPTPAAVTGTTASLAIAVAANVTAGNHTVTLTGTATGVANQTATVTVNVTAAPTGSFSLAVAPTTVAIQAGLSGTATVNITRVAPFTGTVNLTATAPAGITVTANPAAATGATATLNIAVAANVAIGNQTITVNGTGTGVANQSATFTVNVTAAPAGSFSIALNPTTLAVQQGGSSATQVTVTRTGGFTGDVALTATVPANVTVSFSPPTLSGATVMSQMTVTAAANATTGPASITVRGNATGQTEQTATLAVTVNTSTGGGGNVTFTFCGLTGLPLWVAAQDGDGAWARVTGNASNQYSFQISSGRGGVMYVTASAAGGFNTSVFYGTTAELQSQGGTGLCFGTTTAGKTITGTVSGAAPTDFVAIVLGRASTTLFGGPTSFTLNGVLEGGLDLIATRSAFSGGAVTPNSIIIQRNLDIPNNGTVGNLNFATGITPVSATLTLANLGADVAGVSGAYTTPRNTAGTMFGSGALNATTTLTWYGVPAASIQSGEFHVINATAIVQSTIATGLLQTRSVVFITANVAARTVTFGPALSAPTVAVAATTPYVRLRLDFTTQPEYNTIFTTNFAQGTGAAQRNVVISKTAGYIAAGGPTRMEVPDASAAAGWTNTWALQSGAVTTWLFVASGFTGGGIVTPNPVEGAIMNSASRMGQITP